MAWQGTFKKLNPGDSWSGEEGIIGVLVRNFDSGVRYETTVDKEIVEDDGKPFEEGEEIEILIRRVNNG